MKSIEDIIDEVKQIDLKLEKEYVTEINWRLIIYYAIGALALAFVWFYNYNWFKDSNHLVDYSFLLYIGIAHVVSVLIVLIIRPKRRYYIYPNRDEAIRTLHKKVVEGFDGMTFVGVENNIFELYSKYRDSKRIFKFSSNEDVRGYLKEKYEYVLYDYQYRDTSDDSFSVGSFLELSLNRDLGYRVRIAPLSINSLDPGVSIDINDPFLQKLESIISGYINEKRPIECIIDGDKIYIRAFEYAYWEMNMLAIKEDQFWNLGESLTDYYNALSYNYSICNAIVNAIEEMK